MATSRNTRPPRLQRAGPRGDRASRRRSCPSATGCSSRRGAGDRRRGRAIRVRLFAIQRELAGTREVPLDLADGATVADAWDGLVALHPALEPGRASVRFARNGAYADATTPLADGDEVAMIPPVSGGAPAKRRILEIRAEPFDAGSLPSWAIDSRRRRTVRSSASSDGPASRRARRRRARRRRRRATRDRSVEALEYEAHESMALGVLGDDRRRGRGPRFGVERIAIVHRTGEVPLGEVSVADRGREPAP